jgi:hypothetical protein
MTRTFRGQGRRFSRSGPLEAFGRSMWDYAHSARPLIRRAEPFDDPAWTFELNFDGFWWPGRPRCGTARITQGCRLR